MRTCDICRSQIRVSDSSYRVGADEVRACAHGDCLSLALKQQKEQRLNEYLEQQHQETTSNNTETKEQ